MSTDKKPAGVTPEALCKNGTEHGEQSALICWSRLADVRERFPDAEKLFAINNNAGLGDATRGARAKMAGVKKGVADTFLPVMRHGCGGLFVEMKQRKFKTRKAGGLKPEQMQFKAQCQADGYGYVAAYGWEEAKEYIVQYLAS